MHLIDHITVDLILPDMAARSKQDALGELAGLLGSGKGPEVVDQIFRVLRDREQLASTGIGEQIGIPHGKLDSTGSLMLGLGRSKKGLDFDSVDGKPTHLLFVLLAPEAATGVHLKALARISRLCKEPGFRAQLLEASTAQDMFNILMREESKLWTE